MLTDPGTNYLEKLNTQQREAVCHTEGPLLILAGAGSGKTRVLTCRIAYLIGEKQVDPWHILAITFTNKAAGEMRERVDAAIGEGGERVWVSTFHSACCRILRRHIDRLGYDNSFTIYDTQDSRQVMKEVIRQLELDSKMYREKNILARISAAKNDLIDADLFEEQAATWEEKQTARLYHAYQKRLAANNALDFDDLLVKTVELFRKEPEVLLSYQERFRYIMIDEYQDTNTVQFEFVRLLSQRYQNLCVVGDDDQSIYKFRGANIRNILSFEEVFPGARVIRLEQNYRSTSHILEAANTVIAHNAGRKKKTLWTENGSGEQVLFHVCENGYDEANYVIGRIAESVKKEGSPYSSFAVLYRTNAQSRLFEEACVNRDIPYQVVGGVNFYARKEIKDLLAYLKTIDNGADDLAVTRILNIPRRGIGQTTIARIAQYARDAEITFFDALQKAEEIPGTGRALKGIRSFEQMIMRFRSLADYLSVQQLLEEILNDTGYLKELEAEDSDEARSRIENIGELLSKASDYAEHTEEASLSDFLQQVSLVADIDSVEDAAERVLLMTLHAAKGLEFDTVFMTGMEENTFPGYLSIGSGSEEDMEEERRLCYVGMTRAQKRLILTAALQRVVRGEPQFLRVSRFIQEIDPNVLQADRDTTDTRRFLSSGKSPAERGFSSGYERAGSRDAGGSFESVYQRSTKSGRRQSGQSGSNAAKGSALQQMREFRVQKAEHLSYDVGDRVRHVKFGDGEVTEIKEGSRDYEVTVLFDTAGRKRMFASFAKLQKI